MSIFQPSSFAASRTFWPFLPMASDNCVSSTITSSCFSVRSVIETRLTLAGCSAFSAKVVISSRELDDVDLFAAQLADDRLHAHALHAHAGAHRVHVLVAALHRDLGALAGLARNGPDHHRVVVNLRNFRLEQIRHQLRRGARSQSPAVPWRRGPPSAAPRARARPR